MELQLKRDPSVIPARFRDRISTHTFCVLESRSEERVKGKRCWIRQGDGTLQTRDFNVKCNSKGFSLGSGSGVKRYYFTDWEKVPE